MNSNSPIKALLLSLLIFLSNSMSLVFAASERTQVPHDANEVTHTYTFEELGWNSALTLNGYQSSYTFYLPLGKHLNIRKALLHLTMAFSPLLTQDTSVELLLNQSPVRRLMSPSDLTKEVSWDIELPLTQLSPDWQDLTFSAYLTTAKNLCDPRIWIYISPKSSLSLTTDSTPFKGTLNQLPYPFIDPATPNPIPVLLLLPQDYTVGESFALLEAAFRLGQAAGNTKVHLSVNQIHQSEAEQKESHLIFIGRAERVFKELALPFLTPALLAQIENALKEKDGILLLGPSPFNPLFALLNLTGADENALTKALSAFLTPQMKLLVSGQVSFIDQVHLSPKVSSDSETYRTSLKDLGYSDQSVSGLGSHKLSYNLPLPNNKLPHSIHIESFITTPLIMDNNSQVTLSMNGSKISTIWLSKEHTKWKVDINSEGLKPGINRLEYLINLHQVHEQCSQTRDDIWATLYAQTQIQASFLNSFPLAMLNQLPVPFYSEVTVVLPEQLSKEFLNHLAQLFFKLGQLIQPDTAHFHFRTTSQVDKDFIRQHNIILIGTPKANPWIKLALDYLPVQLKGHSRFLNLPQSQLEVSGTSSTGLLELMPSPWSEGTALLLVSGDTEAALFDAIDTLKQDKKRMSLGGNIAIVNADQSTQAFNSYDARYISFRHRVTMNAINLGKNIVYYLQTHPQLFIYLLVLIVPLIVFKRRKK